MRLKVRFHENDQSFSPKFGGTVVVKVHENAEYYDGEYEITPTVDGQTVPVAQKMMREDLTVKAIPIYNVSNTAGGSTFYIATMDGKPDDGLAVSG